MKLAQTKLLIVIFVMIAFMGQSLASNAMVCAEKSQQISQTAQANSHSMSMMEHQAMMNADDASSTANNPSMDCCDKQCKCPVNGCLTIVLFIALHVIDSYNAIEVQPSALLSILPLSKNNSSLYRPPIS